jgi:uncharacterized protein (DUF58 family)
MIAVEIERVATMRSAGLSSSKSPFPFRSWFQRWAAKRAPRAAKVILKHRTIYVFPGRQGLGFLILLLLIWVLGTNYQNNLVLALSFFLTSLMVVSVIHAFKNLLGLTLEPAAVQQAFVGDPVAFDIELSSQYNQGHHGLLFSLADEEPVLIDIAPGHQAMLRLDLPAKRRGWVKLPRVTLKSYFPLGLIRAWAYVELDHRALVFPKPVETNHPPLGPGTVSEGAQLAQARGDEFQGFQTYQPGSPLSQIAWKQFARGAGLHLKDYRALQSQQMWLDWQYLKVQDTELGLSQLSYWVHFFAEHNLEFGLRLPGQTIPMGGGDLHRLEALSALALFGWERED